MLFAAFRAVQAAYFARQVYAHYHEEVARARATDNASDDVLFAYAEKTDNARSNSNGFDWVAFKTSACMHATALGAASYRAAVDTHNFCYVSIPGEILRHIDRNIPRGTGSAENERADPANQSAGFARGHAAFTGQPSYRAYVTHSYNDNASDIIAGIAKSARDAWDYGQDLLNRAYSCARGYLGSGSAQDDTMPAAAKVQIDNSQMPHGQRGQRAQQEVYQTDADLFDPREGKICWEELEDRERDKRVAVL